MAKRKKRQAIQRRAPVQQRSRVTVDAILEASARILRKEGMAGLNTNRIAELAGVSVGSLYGYFPDKSAIIVALARRFFVQDDEALAAALAHDSALPPVRALVRTLITCHVADQDLRRTVMGHHIGLGQGSEHGERTQTGAARIAARLKARGFPSPDPVRFYVMTRAVFGVCRALIEEGDGEPPPAPEIVEDELVRLVEIYLPEPARRRPKRPRAARGLSR